MVKKSLLIKLHLYAGIFTSFYLLAFGFSALVMNHDIKLDNTEYTKTRQTEVIVDPELNDLELATQIRDELNIMGWLPRWEFKRDSTTFSFRVEHPGRKYHIDANLLSGKLNVSEAPKGFWAVFHGLHFLNGKIPNAPFLIKTWQVYQWMALFIMAISIVLGLWLWIKYSYKTWQGFAFGGLFIFTILIMLLI